MWKNSPVFRPAIAAVLGMVGMNFCLQYTHFSIYFTWAVLMLLMTVMSFIFWFKSEKKHKNSFTVVVLFSFFVLGALLFQWNFYRVEENAHMGRRIRVGTAISKPVETEKWLTFKLKERDGGVAMIYLAKGDEIHPENIHNGDSLYVISYFNYPTSYFLRKIEQNKIDERNIRKQERRQKKTINKKKKNKNKNVDVERNDVDAGISKSKAFNMVDDEFEGYKKYLFYQGVSSVAFSSQSAWGYFYSDSIDIKNHRKNTPFYHDIASYMKRKYEMAGFSNNAEAILEALTTGDKSQIPKDTKMQFAKAGISHILALSGFHLTVIVTLLDVLLMRGMFKRRWRKVSALMIIPALWAFAFIAGMPPSLVRATAMCSVIQLAFVIGHLQQLKNACGIALFMMVLANPMYIMDVGFQLSFLSVIGIATVGLPLCEWFKQRVGWWAYFTDVISISLVCTLFTFPVVAYHFGQIPVYSIISNLVVSIIAALFMWAAVIWWIFIWWNWATSVLTWVLNFLATLMI